MSHGQRRARARHHAGRLPSRARPCPHFRHGLQPAPRFPAGQAGHHVADWVERIASTFEAELAPLALEWQEQELPPCELIGSYTLTRPSANALSIVFEIWTYTGGAHGNLDVIPLTYSLLSGQRLGLVDIFENVDKALEIMSAVSRKELATRLGGGRVDSMIHDGTEPLADNFSALALVPGGVRVYFQPYQVAPWAAGTQRVFIPLEKLAPAGPLHLLWGE